MTEEKFVEKMKKDQRNKEISSNSLVPIKPTGCKRPFFYIHGADGYTVDAVLGKYIDAERPFYGIRSVGRDGQGVPHTCIEEMAACYIQEIQTIQPAGPYLLGGRCTGGNIALEIAQQLKKRGQQILLVVMVDSPRPVLTEEEKFEYRNEMIHTQSRLSGKLPANDFDLNSTEIHFNPIVLEHNIHIPVNHLPQIYSGRVIYFSAQQKSLDPFLFDLLKPEAWDSWIEGGIEVYETPGDHMSMTKDPNVYVLAEKLSNCLDQAEHQEKKQMQRGYSLTLDSHIHVEIEAKGYAVIDLLSESEVQTLLKFDQENPPPSSLAPGISFSVNAVDLSYRQLVNQKLKALLAPNLEALLPEYRVALCTLVHKKADALSSEVTLHQDPSFVDESTQQSFGIWCPLIDVNEQNGCLTVVKKSHLLNSKRKPFFAFNGFAYNQEILLLMQQKYLTSVPMKAGQALIYDRRLFHGSSANLTINERVAAACVVVPQKTLTHFSYREEDSNKIETFEVEDEFYDRYIVGQKPSGVKSLGVFDYEVEPVTPEILAQKLEDKTELAQVNYQELDAEGYAVIDFLDEDEVRSLLNLYQESSHPQDLEKRSLAATVSSSDLSYRQPLTQKVREVFHRKTTILFPEYEIILSSFLNKKPDALHSEKSLHQDSSSTDEPCVRSFGVWVPLVDVDERNGCLQVSPKSHLLNSKLRHSLVFGIFPYSQEILSLMQQHYLISVPMKAGQALIYDKRLFHGSPPNLTSAERLVAISILAPKNSPTYFCYVESKASKEIEIFEIDNTFYDRHILSQRPEGVKSLGTVDYEVEPLTTKLLIEKLGEGNSNSQKPTQTDYQINFKPEFLEKFNLSAQKIAVLVSNEFEGFSKNGGIGTYYTTLSQKLAADDWTVILLLCQTEAEFQGDPSFGEVHHVFSTHETAQVLNLQPIHQQILAATQQTDLGESFDHQSICCQFFIQAIASTFPDAVVYAEFPEIWGFGYRTIQAKQSGLLGSSTLIGVTSHGSFEWLQEVNSRYCTDQPQWLWQAYHYEQFSYENADLTYSPSHFLKSRFSGYGWKTSHAKHLPYFVPSLTSLADRQPTPQNETGSNQISIIFFGRLEERKGLCTFVEAVRLLDAAIAPQIHLIFIGKVIPLQSSHLEHLDSQQYLDRELGTAFPYTLLPDLSSQAAIQAIADLSQAIVCLTSLQENFPNTALEMGQLPVSLVVSDTGGFRETLDLLHRTEAVHWFQPGNPNALAQALTQAIQTCPENPPTLEQIDLESINRNLLNQRLELMSQAFLEAAPKEPTTPSVTIALLYWHSATPLLECLTSLAAQTYEHFDVIVMSPAAADEPMQAAIAQAQTQFPRHKYLTSESLGNLGAAYNDLVDQSTGDYFLPFSPDRIAAPDLVEKFVTAACTADAVAVLCPQQVGTAENPETITLIDGNLLKLLEFNHTHDLTALFSKTLLKQCRYSQERGLLALNWQIFATAIATDQPIAYYPYPLYTIPPDSPCLIPAANLAKERYYLRQFLFQIKPEQWHQRQLNLLLTGFEQLAQVQSQRSPSSPQDQAWMLTAQQMHIELTQNQHRLQELESWSRELQTGKDWLESQWQTGMLQTQKAEVEWERSRSLVQEMRGSKFWKLRKIWLKLKRKLGKISTDPLQPAAHTFTPGVQEFVSRIAGQKVRFFQAAASPAPVVSIISTCFSEYAYIETTYRSLINQTLQNFEWIIVDDGSTHPGLKDLLTALPQRTAKIRVVSHAAHQGIAASYNTATAEAKGDYLCFIDMGGILDPTYLEKCVLFLETYPQVSVVNSYSVMFQSQEHWWQPHLNQPTTLFHQNGMISHPVHRKTDFASLGGFDESLPSLTDWERCLKAIAHSQTGWTIPEYLDCYRATSENAPAIAQRPDGQQTISTIHSRHQTVPSLPATIALQPQPLNLNTLNSRLNVENPLDRPNPGKRILLFCEALDNSEVAQWNCDLVILLEQRGYDVTIVTTSTSDHSCQEFFYRATPDIFHLPNLGDRTHWLACLRHLLNSRQIDSVLISGSQLASGLFHSDGMVDMVTEQSPFTLVL